MHPSSLLGVAALMARPAVAECEGGSDYDCSLGHIRTGSSCLGGTNAVAQQWDDTTGSGTRSTQQCAGNLSVRLVFCACVFDAKMRVHLVHSYQHPPGIADSLQTTLCMRGRLAGTACTGTGTGDDSGGATSCRTVSNVN